MKTRFIPEGATHTHHAAAKVDAYRYDTHRNGKTFPTLLAYKGNQRKPIVHEAHTDTAKADEALSRLIQSQTEREAFMVSRRNTPHGLQVGDVLYASWGWEQTNVDFYEVTATPTERTAQVRKLKSEITESEKLSMAGTIVPLLGQFDEGAAPGVLRATGEGTLGKGKLAMSELSRWPGHPMRVSWYG